MVQKWSGSTSFNTGAYAQSPACVVDSCPELVMCVVVGSVEGDVLSQEMWW